MIISDKINFGIEKVHSNKKNKDYYAIVILWNNKIKKVVCFLTDTEAELILSSQK